jgi:hypothetical protein
MGEYGARGPCRGFVAQMEQMKRFPRRRVAKRGYSIPQKYPDSKKRTAAVDDQSVHGRRAGFQIKLREFFLNEIRVIRARLRVRFKSSDAVLTKAVSDQRTKDALRALAQPPYSFLKASAVNRNR